MSVASTLGREWPCMIVIIAIVTLAPIMIRAHVMVQEFVTARMSGGGRG